MLGVIAQFQQRLGDILSSSLRKNIIREIKNTKARFFSIMAIIALGVGFFVGLNAASPSMKQTLADFFDAQDVMDFKIMSTFGFDDDDVKSIADMQDIVAVMPSYSSDIIIDINGQSGVVKLMALPQSNSGSAELNKVILLDGRMPEKNNEILVEQGAINRGYNIGDKIVVEDKAGETDIADIISCTEFDIVGIVQTPLYISFQRGNSIIGDGSIEFYAMVNPSAFKYERYTEVYIKTKYLSTGLSEFSDEYEQKIKRLSDRLSDLGTDRVEIFKSDTIDTAWKELNDNEEEYNQKISEGRQSLEDAYEALKDAKLQLDTGKYEYETKIKDGEEQLEMAKKELEQGKIDLEDAQLEMTQQLEIAEFKLSQAQKEYDSASDTFNNITKPQAELAINVSLKMVEQSEMMISYLEILLIDVSEEKAEKLREQIEINTKKIEESRKELEEAQKQLNDGEKQMKEAKMALDQANLDYLEQKHNGEKQLLDAQRKLEKGEAEYKIGVETLEKEKISGKKQLKEAEEEYNKGQIKYDESVAEFEIQSKVGLKKINDAKEYLEKLNDLTWYTFTREDLLGYTDYIQDSDRMQSVASIFPLFFLLVAALVCLTTMTRMIDERRTEIGIFKALGYSSTAIAGKYLIYASFAALVGCTVGILVGVFSFPRIIFNAYGIMYDLPNFHLIVPNIYVIVGICAALLCTTIVVIISCSKELKIFPATLMRPKAPKPGKKILLERIKIIWSHMSFTSKVTARNLFRYKIRFAMTVVGVAGCTALIVAAFGLKDSIGIIVSKQFDDISKYDVIFVPSESKDEVDALALSDEIGSDYRIDDVLSVNQVAIKVVDAKVDSLYMVVPQDLEIFCNIFNFQERTTGEKIDFRKCNTVLTEKAAQLLGVSIGDSITYVDNDIRRTVVIDAICENYIYNYLYINPEYYKEIYGKPTEYNTVMASLYDDVTEIECDSMASSWISRDDIMAVQFMSNSVGSFTNMIQSLNKVIVIMIACAAALAFIVLYNLTNINISERAREIATLKVLGFYNSESAFYIYRESIIMALVGTLCGLFAGIFLCKFIVTTVEVDMVMFGRDIFATTYIYAAALTALFAFLVNLLMYFKMKKIDMIESLKSVE